jgi:hypothetical protein
MTLPSSGALVLGSAGGGNSINSEFGYGNDLASYQGVYYGKGGQEYRFPVSGNLISMGGSLSPGDAGFYSTYKITGGSITINSSQTYIIPVYNTITITCVGGQGGQSGSWGYSSCGSYIGPTTSSNGGSGYSTSFGGYVASGGGNGGSGNAVAGSYGPTITSTFTNPVQGGSGPSSGSSVSASVGGGGSGGGGGANIFINYPPFNYCAAWNSAASGSAGGAGYITITWS